MAKPNYLIIVATSSGASRALPVAAIFVALIFGWLAVRTQLGNMLAELTGPSDPDAYKAVDLARSLAPSDPLSMWLKATLEKNSLSSQHTDSAVMMFEDTVRLSPRDFRWWLELGRAYEQEQRFDKADAAFLHALSLAPNYTFAHWQIGNYYLRRGRMDDALAELRKATEKNETYRIQVFSLAWDYFDQDPARLEQIAADQPDVYVSLATFYAQRNRPADALRIWNKISDGDKSKYPLISKAIAQGLMDRRDFPQALEFDHQNGTDTDAVPEAVTNPGFEVPIGNAAETHFGWRVIRNDPKLEIASDSAVHHDGAKSLRIEFKNYVRPDLYTPSQLIVVEPGKSYKLRFWLRTESLRSAGMPQLQVVNGNDDKIITLTSPFPTGTSEWHEVDVDLTAPDNCNGVVLRTARGFCGDNCPLTGTFWYDDFVLTKTS